MHDAINKPGANCSSPPITANNLCFHVVTSQYKLGKASLYSYQPVDIVAARPIFTGGLNFEIPDNKLEYISLRIFLASSFRMRIYQIVG